ncbi:hypothetical protein pb186bvf_012918 [Paramecium bursaria]
MGQEQQEFVKIYNTIDHKVSLQMIHLFFNFPQNIQSASLNLLLYLTDQL